MKLISSYKLHAREEQVELEGKPVRPPDSGSYIEKSGTLWCVRSKNPNDKNFGCYASRQEAEAHMRSLYAGGPGSGCNPEVGKCGRPKSADAPTIMYDQSEMKSPTPFMRLTLSDNSFPYLFNIDNLHWAWNKDRSQLTIEEWGDQVGGIKHKDIYEVPGDLVEEWQGSTGQRPDMGPDYYKKDAGKNDIPAGYQEHWIPPDPNKPKAKAAVKAAGLERFRVKGYGTSEGVAKSWEHRQRTGHVWDSILISRMQELEGIRRTPQEHAEYQSIKKHLEIKGESQYGRTGWDYGRAISKQVGFVPKRELGGFPRTQNTAVVPRRSAKPLGNSVPIKRGGIGKGTGFGVKTHPHVSKIMRSPNLGHAPRIKMPRSPMTKSPSTSPMGRSGLLGFADMGEPMTGAMGHAHIDPVVWFKPPSLTKRGLDQRVPTDDPRETDDKYGDVTKRNSKDTLEQKYKMLKRSAPGGLPPAIPAKTTAIEPHQAFYTPLSQLFSSSVKTPKKVLRGSNFTSFTRRGCI